MQTTVIEQKPQFSPAIKPEINIEAHPEGGYRLTAEMFVALPREEVFGFFADARELGRITPPWLDFKILTPMPVEMQQGTLLDYRIRLRGIPIRWRTEICVWEPSSRFVDQQLKGPYRRWYHEHTFESVDGGTLVKDNVHYMVPFGDLVHRLFVKSDLVKIFQFRQDTLKEIFDERIAAK